MIEVSLNSNIFSVFHENFLKTYCRGLDLTIKRLNSSKFGLSLCQFHWITELILIFSVGSVCDFEDNNHIQKIKWNSGRNDMLLSSFKLPLSLFLLLVCFAGWGLLGSASPALWPAVELHDTCFVLLACFRDALMAWRWAFSISETLNLASVFGQVKSLWTEALFVETLTTAA